MKIFFLSPFCMLRPTTNRIFDVRLCDALASKGADVRLIYPFYEMKENIQVSELNRVYDIRSALKFEMLHTSLKESSSKYYQSVVLIFVFFARLIKIAFAERKGKERIIIMSRDHKVLLPAVLLRKVLPKLFSFKIIVNVHEVKTSTWSKWLYKNYDGVWTTTTTAQKVLGDEIGVEERKMQSIQACVEPPKGISKEEARKSIGYSSAIPLIVYTGKLGKGVKELDYLMEAAMKLQEYNFIFTGGKNDTIAYLKNSCVKKNIQNITFSGFINDVAFVRYYQLAADVLVSYYTRKDHLVEYNLPQKLMEYMFSGNAIVTPDFAASRPFINNETAVLVNPDDVDSLVEGIKKAAGNKALAATLANNAYSAIKDFTFEKRADVLMQSLKQMEQV